MARRAKRGRKRPYHHGRLRQALLDASLEIIAELGVSGLSLREAARRAGVSHAAPKRHFATATDLYCAVAEDAYRRLRAHLLARLAERPAATALEAFGSLGVAYVEFAVTHPGHFRAMFHPGVGERPTPHPLEEEAGAAFAVLVEAVERAQAAGDVRVGPSKDIALGAWSLMHGLAVLAVDRQLVARGFSSGEPLALARQLTQLLYLGLHP
jgi:AcrR family transcriptional regulator